MRKNHPIMQYFIFTYDKHSPPGWFNRWAWRGLWGGAILALISMATSCGTIPGEPPCDAPCTITTRGKEMRIDTSGYIVEGGTGGTGKPASGATLNFEYDSPYVYQQQGDTLKIVGGTRRIDGYPYENQTHNNMLEALTDEELQREVLRRKRFSPQALRMAQLFAYGKTTAEIAKELHLSPRTVEATMDRLRSELDAKTRLHLICILMRTQKIK